MGRSWWEDPSRRGRYIIREIKLVRCGWHIVRGRKPAQLGEILVASKGSISIT
jgi:hypothetical protein